jgi:phage gp36-like protein
MSYSTQDDLLKLVPEADLAGLTTESGDVPDAAVVSEVIAKADAEIDGYLGIRYQVPLSPVPDLVKAMSLDLAVYNLHKRRPLLPMPETCRQSYVDAINFLKSVVAGNATIGASAAPPPAVASEVAEIGSSERVFSLDSLKGF